MANPTPPSQTPTATTPWQVPPALSAIQTKVRRIVRKPSPAQLSDADLNNYINTFIVYDFPEQLRTFNLRTTFTFYTNPGQDIYNTDEASFAGAVNNPLYNFQNLYLSMAGPVYIAGYQALFSQSREQFYGIYPLVRSIALTATQGNGTSGPFTGVINSQQSIIPPGFNQQISLLQNNVLFSAIGTPGTGEEIGMSMVDVPLVDPISGFKLNIGNLYDANSAAYNDPVTGALAVPPTIVNPSNTINYLTGVYTVNFPMNTVQGTMINSQTVPQIQGLPQAVCFYSNQFIVRPVPDASYAINFEVYQRPTALMSLTQVPELEEYWQYIAYGAAKKIFEDQMDLDSVALIMPEFKMQERLCLRRSLVQWSNERVGTIYADQTTFGGGYGWGWGSSGPF